MTPESVIVIGQQALVVTAMLSAPLLLAALAAGLVIGMFQAATQINEVTLSFIPKLLVLAAALYLGGGWSAEQEADFKRPTLEMFARQSHPLYASARRYRR